VHLGLLLVFDLSGHLVSSLSLLGLGFAALAWAARRVGDTSPPAVGVLLVALALRALLLPLPPTLSDDVLRYVWDGWVVTAGFDPYTLPPEAEELAPLRDELWQRLPHKEVPTVYPPLALGLFSIAALLPAPLLALKVLLTLGDLLTCWILLRLAERRRLPTARVLWYAWNPLVVLEVAGMGHVDALGVTMVAVTLLALTASTRRPPPRTVVRAAASAVGGVLAKLAPAAALPYWSLRSRRPVLFLLTAAGLLAVVGLPVLIGVGGVPPGLVTYGVQWEFNGPVYEPLWRLLDVLGLADHAKLALDAFKEMTEQWTRWNWIYPYLYPRLLARLALAAGAALVVARSVVDGRRGIPLLHGTARLFGGLLLLSPTFYPWYLLWVLPWAVLLRHRAWRLLSGTILLSYVPQFTDLELFPWVFLLIWLPFWGALVFGGRGSGAEPAFEPPVEPSEAGSPT
jgi:hypothetical protein